MESTRQLLFLILGLCLIFYHVSADASSGVRLIGNTGNIFQPLGEMSGKLQHLKSRQAYLEQELKKRTNPFSRMGFEMDLQVVKSSIATLEANLKVPYKDYIQSMSEQRQNFEKEKAELRKRLVDAENLRIQANDALTLQKLEKGGKIDFYQQEVEKLTDERNKLAKDYAKFTDAYYQKEQKMKQERDLFLAKQGQLQQELDEAKKKHAQALEAITNTPAESYRSFSIPEKDKINSLRNDITKFNGMKNRKKLKEGLERTRKTLQELLDKLYTDSKFSVQTTREDLQNALNEMEKNAILKRKEQDNRRKELVEKMKQKDLTNYNDEELASLQKTNAEVAALDRFQKEIDRKNAYLNAILEVSDLLKECSDAIRDANERNLANVWADAIQEAKDSPLAKFWADAIKEAKDSDFAKAWAVAIQNANTNIAKAWTDAIREIKDSPVAKMWGEAVKNVQAGFDNFIKML